MPTDYQDRFDANRYFDDERYVFTLVPQPADTMAHAAEATLPERLAVRLRFLGFAFELPLLSRLPLSGTWTYPEVQIPPLSDEIAFVLSHVDDALLASELAEIGGLLLLGARQPRGWNLVVDAP